MLLTFNCSAEGGERVKSREQEQGFCSMSFPKSILLQQAVALPFFFFLLLFERISINNICIYN